MKETEAPVLGVYDCEFCGSTFKITGSSVTTGYTGWLPTCPVCQTDEKVHRVESLE